jgi:cytochrome d ubiquinol oxidase subunit II
METLWFWLVAIMLVAYVILDGFDLGVGIIHFWIGRTEAQRRHLLRTIGPVWDGNEVWLLAAGGTLYFAFPGLYASSFSGFYLPLMIVLWLLILRGIAIEFRNHLDNPVWRPFWDAVFTGGSSLLAVFFGAALGNGIRGVPLDASGYFFLPLWTDFRVSREAGILDWYTILVGILAWLALTLHGALWAALKTDGDLRQRAQRVAAVAWLGVGGMSLIVTGLTLRVQPQVSLNLEAHPWGYVFPALALAGLLGILHFVTRGADLIAFLASCLYLAGMLASAAFGVYPYVLPSNTDPKLGLTIYSTATSGYGLLVGLAWWIPGMLLALGYFVYAYRQFAGKVRAEDEGY